MKIIAKNQAAKIQNSDQCKVTEYPFDIKDINGCQPPLILNTLSILFLDL